MCYKKKKGEGKRERKRNRIQLTTNLAYKQVLSLQSHVAWQNATDGSCKAWGEAGESMAWQSGGGQVKSAG